MAKIWADRVKETSTTTGTGDITLAGAVDRFRAFSAVCATNDTFEYAIEGAAGTGEWEIGLGTYSATNTLTRTTVYYSSNTNAAVSFSAGTKTVILTPSARRVEHIETPLTPGGRLTLVSATPVMTSDQTAKTSIYYTPYVNDRIPIYDGAFWTSKLFSELTLTLDSTNHAVNQVYDVFVWNDAGTIKVGTGPAWTASATITVTIASPGVVSWTGHGLAIGDVVYFSTTGALPTGITAGTAYYVSASSFGANSFRLSSSAANAMSGTNINTTGSQSGTHTATCYTRRRGTGSGTTEIERKNAIWTNKNSITLINGSGAGTSGIAANTATYVGSFVVLTAGQVAETYFPAAASGGPSGGAQAALYNAYNRIRRTHRTIDNNSWTYTTGTWRPTDNSVNNRIWFLDGLAESTVEGFTEVGAYSSSANTQSVIGMNLNDPVATPATAGLVGISGSFYAGQPSSTDTFFPTLGWNYVTGMENNSHNQGTVNFYGPANGGGNLQRTQIMFDH